MKFDFIMWASAFYLTKPLPENWQALPDDQLSKFLHEYAWKPFENSEPDFIFELIENLAENTQQITAIITKENN
jgi:hypothetical protein